MVRGPLPPGVSQAANQAVKGLLGGQAQKLIDAQVSRAIGPLLARIDELEKRVATLERGRQTGRQQSRSDDI